MPTAEISKPMPTLQPPASINTEEFDPCSNAKPCSPFYLYNHDSPRPSTDHKTKPSLNISERDLETGSTVLTPSTTQEKLDNNRGSQGRLASLRGKLLLNRCQRQMTHPKPKGRIARLPKKQRILVRSLITLLVVGCMIGLAVGLAAGLKSGVWKSNNQQGDIRT